MDFSTHIRRTLALGVPLIGSLVAQMAIQLTDAVMLGRYDVVALAGQVLGSTLFTLALLFGSGFGWAVTPVVAEADARGQVTDVRRVTRMALWLSAGFGALVMPLFLMSGPVFLAMGQEAETARIAAQYLFVQGWSIFPALGLMVVRAYLSGLGRTRAQFWAMAGALVLNGLVNYALIFGAWGAPELGVTGAAIGSVVSTGAAFGALAVYAAVTTPEHAIFARLWRPDWSAMGRVFALGWPQGQLAEDLCVRVEGDACALAVGRGTGIEDGALGDAAAELLRDELTVTGDFDPDVIGQRVDDRDTDAVQTAGGLVGLAAELAARVQGTQDDFQRGLVRELGVRIGGDATPVVGHGARPVGMQLDPDAVGVTGDGLVHGVVEHLCHQVVQRSFIGAADVHAGAFADRL